jgi:hypothetical protein
MQAGSHRDHLAGLFSQAAAPAPAQRHIRTDARQHTPAPSPRHVDRSPCACCLPLLRAVPRCCPHRHSSERLPLSTSARLPVACACSQQQQQLGSRRQGSSGLNSTLVQQVRPHMPWALLWTCQQLVWCPVRLLIHRSCCACIKRMFVRLLSHCRLLLLCHTLCPPRHRSSRCTRHLLSVYNNGLLPPPAHGQRSSRVAAAAAATAGGSQPLASSGPCQSGGP